MSHPSAPPATPGRQQHAVWERIADSFDRSRTRTWPHVEAFLRGPLVQRGAHVLDLMAGNGRHVPAIEAAGHRALWLDWSRPAAAIAAARYPSARVVVGDATRLPLGDGAVDACILVAGLHSLATQAERVACLKEVRRVVRPGGHLHVTVWSRDAPRFAGEGTPGQPVDVTIPWRSHGHDEARHYHLATAASLRAEVEAAGWTVVAEDAVAIVSRTAPDNLVVLARA